MKYEISLPPWAVEQMERLPARLPSVEDRMRAVIRFSELNFQNRTGGPFAAGVFEQHSGRMVAIGVNRVIPSCNSSAHAEMVALSLAQQSLGTFDLGAEGMPAHQLVVSARPCAMCFGAIPWSGIRSLVVAATGEMIERLTGFDEGPIHPNWQRELDHRGIEVIEDLLADEAAAVLQAFGDSDQTVYNGRGGGD